MRKAKRPATKLTPNKTVFSFGVVDVMVVGPRNDKFEVYWYDATYSAYFMVAERDTYDLGCSSAMHYAKKKLAELAKKESS